MTLICGSKVYRYFNLNYTLACIGSFYGGGHVIFLPYPMKLVIRTGVIAGTADRSEATGNWGSRGFWVGGSRQHGIWSKNEALRQARQTGRGLKRRRRGGRDLLGRDEKHGREAKAALF